MKFAKNINDTKYSYYILNYNFINAMLLVFRETVVL